MSQLCEIRNLNLVEDDIHFLRFCPMCQALKNELYQNTLSLDRIFSQYTDTDNLDGRQICETGNTYYIWG